MGRLADGHKKTRELRAHGFLKLGAELGSRGRGIMRHTLSLRYSCRRHPFVAS
jgi:hypothetical protein